MAEGRVGMQREDVQEWAPWTRIFIAFKIAKDPKKLLLAAGGILTMAFGWWLLALVFFWANSTPPVWKDYQAEYADAEKPSAGERKAWDAYKRALNNWNLMYQLAGPVPDTREEAKGYVVADFVVDLNQYKNVIAEKERIESLTKVRRRVIEVKTRKGDDAQHIEVDFKNNKDGVKIIEIDRPKGVDPKVVEHKLAGLTAQKLHAAYNKEKNQFELPGLALTVTNDKHWKDFDEVISKAPSLGDEEEKLKDGVYKGAKAKAVRTALNFMRTLDADKFKPAGYLRTWPFFEDRGPNPYRLISGMNPNQIAEYRQWPWAEGRFSEWLLTMQIPTLLEPLVKFFSPVFYLFYPYANWLTRLYLVLVILWTVMTWSLFGGAITRMAAVEAARPNESTGMREALRFAMQRYLSYFSAQMIPLAILAFLVLLLIVFGFLEMLIPILGDVVLAGLGLPIVILFGLIMAVLIVGLVGWPMMHATISTEGSDAFDAISRSYSYVYQAPWHYVWNWTVALLYGAVLIFFVGLMGSLTVYLGKMGMSLGGAANFWDREPSYLFTWAPTSYGWRELLLDGSPHISTVEVIRPSGTVGQTYVLSDSFAMYPWNWLGRLFVTVWVGLLFLLVLGFGYSFFWTAGTIIYLLMRQRVDDTEIDEIHMEEDDIDTPFMPPAEETGKTDAATSLQMVESPTLRTDTPAAPAEPPKEPDSAKGPGGEAAKSEEPEAQAEESAQDAEVSAESTETPQPSSEEAKPPEESPESEPSAKEADEAESAKNEPAASQGDSADEDKTEEDSTAKSDDDEPKKTDS